MEGSSVGFEVEIDGLKMLAFLHDLKVYLMLPDDIEQRKRIIAREKAILDEFKDEFGRELIGLQLCAPIYH